MIGKSNRAVKWREAFVRDRLYRMIDLVTSKLGVRASLFKRRRLLSGKPPSQLLVPGPRMLIVEVVVVNLPRSNEEVPVGSVRKREEYITIFVCPSYNRPLATALHPMRVLLTESILVAGNGFPEAPAHSDLHLVDIARRGRRRESTIYGSSQTSRFPIPCWCPKRCRNSRTVHRTPFAPVRVSSWLTRTVGTATGEEPMRFPLVLSLCLPSGLSLTQWRCCQTENTSGSRFAL